MAREPQKCNDGQRLIITSIGGVQMTEDGILVTCSKCGKRKSVFQFGFRKMPKNELRNQPQCIECRSASGAWTKGRGGA